MTFGTCHYVPVLKVKRGEKTALSRISSGLKQNIVPLLEIVERTSGKSVNDHLDTSFKDLAPSLRGYQRCLLDVREMANDGQVAAANALARALAEGIVFTPVTGISRTADVVPVIACATSNGIGIRLTRQEFEDGNLTAGLQGFLIAHNLAPGNVDLIVDLGPAEDLIPAGIAALTRAFLAAVPFKQNWRTLTVTGSAFPLSMAIVDRNSSKFVERSEWIAWRDELFSSRHTLERLPTYSDCVIQHPIGVENFDPRYMLVSAAIRYTWEEYWLLVKGESTRSVAPSVQFPQLATQLVYGRLRSFFAGAGHCAGCQMAKDAADGARGFGSAEVWRRIGTIHHITTVIQDDLGSLPWP